MNRILKSCACPAEAGQDAPHVCGAVWLVNKPDTYLSAWENYGMFGVALSTKSTARSPDNEVGSNRTPGGSLGCGRQAGTCTGWFCVAKAVHKAVEFVDNAENRHGLRFCGARSRCKNSSISAEQTFNYVKSPPVGRPIPCPAVAGHAFSAARL